MKGVQICPPTPVLIGLTLDAGKIEYNNPESGNLHFYSHTMFFLTTSSHIPPTAPPSSYLPLPFHLQEKVALPAVVIPTVTLHYRGGGGHQAKGRGDGASHAHLGKLL